MFSSGPQPASSRRFVLYNQRMARDAKVAVDLRVSNPIAGGRIVATSLSETEHDTDVADYTLADIKADIGSTSDPTGDYAAGRTHVHESTEDFLSCLNSVED